MTQNKTDTPPKPMSPPKFIEPIKSPIKKIPSPAKIPSPVKFLEQHQVPEIHLPVKRSHDQINLDLNSSPSIIAPKVNLNSEHDQHKTSHFIQPDVTSSEEEPQPDEEEEEDLTN